MTYHVENVVMVVEMTALAVTALVWFLWIVALLVKCCESEGWSGIAWLLAAVALFAAPWGFVQL